MNTDLSCYDNSWYDTGGGRVKRLAWFVINNLIIRNHYNPLSGLRIKVLRVFGARVGAGVVIKPGVNIKYPWNLTIGDYSWIGEDVWIDNLARTTIGSNCCISQGAMLLCGNHNYKKSTFDLMVREITIEDGVWVCAKAVVCPGAMLRQECVLSIGSVANGELEAGWIYRGNPAVKYKRRPQSRQSDY